jgi:choline dehydrogenase-like flavoprotein
MFIKGGNFLLIAITIALLSQSNADEEFDFIILAGGTSGSVLARRISENPKWSVLVLEEGALTNPQNNIPLNVNRVARDCSNLLGLMYSIDDDCCLAMRNQQCRIIVSKGLGGHTILGDMVHSRGNRQDFDRMCQQGNHGWSFKDVLPFYKRVEQMTMPSGKIEMSYPKFLTGVSTAFMNAGKELGYSWVNYNGVQQTGFSLAQTTLKDGLRNNAYNAYLAPVVDTRSNLIIRTEVKFQRLLFESNKHGETRVSGVQYDHLKFPHTVRAKREVIITTSPVEVAHLLMLSGVGPADHLKEHGIEVVKNLPVGYNYHDIVGIGGLVFFSNSSMPDLEKTFTKNKIEDFLQTRAGPAASPITEAIAFMESSKSTCGYPDFQLTLRAGGVVSMPMRREIYNLNDTMVNEHYGEILNNVGNTFDIFATVSRPLSRGRVKLQSANPNDMPNVMPNFYTDPNDMKIALRVIKTVLQLVETNAFKAINATFYDKVFAPCAKFKCTQYPKCDDSKYWDCYARFFTFPAERWAGTTRMGPVCDKEAVVDAKMRVHGIKNLRIVSAAINAQQITGHVEAYRYMLGEKASDMICRKYHKEKKYSSMEDQ